MVEKLNLFLDLLQSYKVSLIVTSLSDSDLGLLKGVRSRLCRKGTFVILCDSS